jgi:hypothetical protein
MAGNGLQEFREQLTLAYLSDVIDIEDFVYLYQTNQLREIFPYCRLEITADQRSMIGRKLFLIGEEETLLFILIGRKYI